MGKRLKTTKEARMGLYAASRYLGTSTEQELGLQVPFDVYLQDPWVAKTDPKFGFDREFHVRWEPGIADGPTSARFAVVDYVGDEERLAPPAKWDEKREEFLDPDGKALNSEHVKPLQFHQVNVWAVLQRALAFFEEGNGLGRRIPFGFDGNRLIVVPHAGYGRNAFYDRQSKSLQFYYFDKDKERSDKDEEDPDNGKERVYTCLSTDIINHEFGHAALDGIRPYYFESSLVQTAAFHEFIGDLTAILIILRNNDFRKKLAETTGGKLKGAAHLASIAEQFGNAVSGQPYLRNAQTEEEDEKLKMSDIAGKHEPHDVSELMTKTMYEILLKVSEHYIEERGHTAAQGFWYAIYRMQRMALQPLDLLPPVDVLFKDYALAVLRAEELTNPTDPYGYRDLMLEVFHEREILDDDDKKALEEPHYLYDRPRFSVFHDIENISRSRASAYAFLDDNREDLFIPAHQDIVVADLYDANKMSRQGSRLPRQVILEYIWREEVVLDGPRFGEYDGEITSMLCGGTLVFDEHGNVLSWSRKPGTEGEETEKRSKASREKWEKEIEIGLARREALLEELARRIDAGHVGAALGSSKGMVGALMPPLTVRRQAGSLRFEISPHLNLSGDADEGYEGGPRWEVSS